MIGKYCYSYNGETYDGEFETLKDLYMDLAGNKENFKNIKVGRYSHKCNWELGIRDYIIELTDDNNESLNGDSVIDHIDEKLLPTEEEIDAVLKPLFDRCPINWYAIEDISGEELDKWEKLIK